MDKTSKTLLESVLSLPTMSFNETAVATFVKWYAKGFDLDVSEDRAGNILVKYRGGSKGGITFTAHMDHPGFEIVSSNGESGVAALWGKVDPKFFAGSKVAIYTEEGATKGRIGKIIPNKKHFGKPCFSISSEREFLAGDFGHYDLPGISFKKDRIYARAADNLMGVTAILDLMTRLKAKGTKVNVTGLFTRCEEAGFLGAFAAMETGIIPKGDPLIVLECSSAPGGKVDIGGGPVIRAGDLQCTYDPNIEAWMSDVASELSKREKTFSYQRALLQGGRCEACVYVANDYATSGIALPLGNYHNHGPKRYAAEYVSAKDYENMVRLIEALARAPKPHSFLSKKLEPIRKNYRKLKGKLIKTR